GRAVLGDVAGRLIGVVEAAADETAAVKVEDDGQGGRGLARPIKAQGKRAGRAGNDQVLRLLARRRSGCCHRVRGSGAAGSWDGAILEVMLGWINTYISTILFGSS